MNTTFGKDPISKVTWINVDNLKSNNYNPNVVLNQELKLLEFSILKNGWIQPILVGKDNTIIDGYHRHFLSKQSKKLREKYNGLVPCVIMDLDTPERMLLTIRINRAKGNHVAVLMHEIVTELINDYDYTIEQIREGIGCTKQEVDLLYKKGVFDALNIKEHKYSKAWKSPKSV
jgi:ParB-like chromosome segregation protein Spo0J